MTAAVADPVFDALGLAQGIASREFQGNMNVPTLSQWPPTWSNNWYGSATATVGANLQPRLVEGTTLGKPELPTAGSAAHHTGTCKPCAFVHTKGCNSGASCQFCHLCEPGARKQRKKDQLELRRRVRSGSALPLDAQPPPSIPATMAVPGLPAPWCMAPSAILPGSPWVTMPPMPPGLGLYPMKVGATAPAIAPHVYEASVPMAHLQRGPLMPPGNFHMMPQTPPPKTAPILATSPLKNSQSKSGDNTVNKTDAANDASATAFFEELLAKSAGKRAKAPPVLKLSDMVCNAMPDTPAAALRMCMRSVEVPAGTENAKAATAAASTHLLQLVKGGKDKSATRKPLDDGVAQGAALLKRIQGGNDTPSTVSSDGDEAPVDIGKTLLKQLRGARV